MSSGEYTPGTVIEELAIFPLPQCVLFPGTILPLHVFEPRYRVMTERVLASVIEAVIGACFLHAGYERTAVAVVQAFEPELEHALEHPVDFKSTFQERLAQRGEVVVYEVTQEMGPPHDRTFEVRAVVDGRIAGTGVGRSKKAAEQELKIAASAFEHEKGRGPKIAAARERFGKARDRVAARLAELRETENWKRWANVPKLEKLCERMEALKDLADPKEAAAQLKVLQAEWKTVGAAPKEKSEALWQRFKAAGDEVFKKTHEGFEKLTAERTENLAAAIPHAQKTLWLLPGADHRLNLEFEAILARADAMFAQCGVA